MFTITTSKFSETAGAEVGTATGFLQKAASPVTCALTTLTTEVVVLDVVTEGFETTDTTGGDDSIWG